MPAMNYNQHTFTVY